MQKSVERKAKKENNTILQKPKDKLTKTQSEMVFREPLKDEVALTVDFKEIRYGRKSLIDPEITTLVNNSKVVLPVPFASPLKYGFGKTEDEMVFKFAVTTAGDLVGFVYLEIPHKFKSINKFKLDDWFPVKLVQTSDQEKLKIENFMARVVVNYESVRKLDGTALNATPKLLKTQLAEETQRNLRQKIDGIHEQVDAVHGEGFRHLEDFHHRLMEKKIKSTTALIEQGMKDSLSRSPVRLVNTQKEVVYNAKRVLGASQEVKNDTLPTRSLFNRSANASPDPLAVQKSPSCLNCENFTKELAFTRKELIEANQKLSAMEEKQMSVDNVKLKRQLEAMREELNRDRKELSTRLKDNAAVLEADRQRLAKVATADSSKATKLQKEANAVLAECKVRVKEADQRESSLAEREAKLEARLTELTKNENEYIRNMQSFLKERDEHFRDKTEWDDIKQRMIQERKRIHEEASKFQFLKSDLNLKKEQLYTLDEYFGEEKNKFRQEMDDKTKEIESLRYELARKQELFGLERRHFDEQTELLEERNSRLQAQMKLIKQEEGRLAQLRNQLTENEGLLREERQTVDQNHAVVLQEMQKDYQYLEGQMQLVEQQRKELASAKATLEHYERMLDEQSRLHHDQQARFNLLAKQAAQKVSSSDFDTGEVRRLFNGFVAEVRECEERFNEFQLTHNQLQKNKDGVRKSLAVIADRTSRHSNARDQKSVTEHRLSKKFTEFSEDVIANRMVNARELNDKDEQILQLKDRLREAEEEVESLRVELRQKAKSHPVSANFGKPFADSNARVDLSKLDDIATQLEGMFDHQRKKLEAQKVISGQEEIFRERTRALGEAQLLNKRTLVLLETVIQSTPNELSLEGGVFDYEKIVLRYEKKIKDLMEFIQRVKDNTDFFNNNMDNEILIR